MRDSEGHVVGRGTTPPIMITDARSPSDELGETRARMRQRDPDVARDDFGALIGHAYQRDGSPFDDNVAPRHGVSSATELSAGPGSAGSSFGLSWPPPSASNHWSTTTTTTSSVLPVVDVTPRAYNLRPASRSLGGANVAESVPSIFHLAPSSGSILGGTEVIVLGENFDPSRRVVFGETVAVTQWWSAGALRCIAPPSAIAGRVAVSIEGFAARIGGGPGVGGADGQQLQWFKYEDSRTSDL